MQVRITQKLIDSCKSLISNMRGSELDNNPLPFDFATHVRASLNVQSVADYAWGEHLHLRDAIPAGWLTKTNELQITVTGIKMTRLSGSVSDMFTPPVVQRLPARHEGRH